MFGFVEIKIKKENVGSIIKKMFFGGGYFINDNSYINGRVWFVWDGNFCNIKILFEFD